MKTVAGGINGQNSKRIRELNNKMNDNWIDPNEIEPNMLQTYIVKLTAPNTFRYRSLARYHGNYWYDTLYKHRLTHIVTGYKYITESKARWYEDDPLYRDVEAK